MNLIVFDRDEQRIADLNPESIQNPLQIEDSTGAMTLQFEYSLTEEDSLELQMGNFIALYDSVEGMWYEYEITKTIENDEFIKVETDHRYTELATEEIVSWNTNGDAAIIPITNTLAKTRWQVGKVEIQRNLQRSVMDKNPLEALRYIEQEWGGVLRFRVEITGAGTHSFYVDLLERRGSFKGDRFEFGHNLQSFEHTVDFALVKTALYGRGKGQSIPSTTNEDGTTTTSAEDTVKLTFADIEWKVANGDPIDKPLGQDWVGDETRRLVYGKPDGKGGRKHNFGTYDSQAETQDGLLWETWFKLQETYDPIINIVAKVIDLERYSDTFKHEQARFGDDVYVTADYKGRSINLMAGITRIERNPDDPADTVIELGNFVPAYSNRIAEIEKQVSLQAARAGIYEKAQAFKPNGKLDTSFLEGIIDAANSEIRSSLGFTYQTAEGILVLNDDRDTGNPTKALLLSGGMLALSNEKDAMGNWIWRTFGDGDGFIADELISGSLRTDLVQIYGDANFLWNKQNIYISDPLDGQKQIRIGKYDGKNYGISFTQDGGATWEVAIGFDGISIGSNTNFENGYDPSDKADVDYIDKVEKDKIPKGGVFTGTFYRNADYAGKSKTGYVQIKGGTLVTPSGKEYVIKGDRHIKTRLKGSEDKRSEYLMFVGSDTTRIVGGKTWAELGQITWNQL